MKKILTILVILVFSWHVMGQHIPVPLTQVRLYDFIDELLTDGVIYQQTSIRPYTRDQVAEMLLAAQQADSLLNSRQQKDLKFYLNEFALIIIRIIYH